MAVSRLFEETWEEEEEEEEQKHLRVVDEALEAVDKVGAVERVAADADDSGLAETLCGGLEDGLGGRNRSAGVQGAVHGDVLKTGDFVRDVLMAGARTHRGRGVSLDAGCAALFDLQRVGPWGATHLIRERSGPRHDADLARGVDVSLH